MGLSVEEAKRMTVWETTAVMEIWAEAHGSGSGKLSEGETNELWAFVQEQKAPATLAAARSKGNGAGHGR